MKISSTYPLLLTLLFLSFCTIHSFGQWQLSEGPYGAEVHCFLKFDNKLFTGTAFGLYESNDNGSHWQKTSNKLALATINCLASSGGILFAGTSGRGLYVSEDSGKTWRQQPEFLKTPFSEISVTSIATKDSLIFAGCGQDGLYKSSDYGKTWKELGPEQPPAQQLIDHLLIVNDHLLTTTFHGILRVNITGGQWENLVENQHAMFNTLYAENGRIISIDNNTGDIYLSTDEGAHWEVTASPKTANASSIVRLGDNLYTSTYFRGIVYSADSGATWEEISPQPVNSGVTTLYSDGKALLLGTIKGLYISEGAGQPWRASNTGLHNITIYSYAANGNEMYLGTDNGIFKGDSQGLHWQQLNDIDSAAFGYPASLQYDEIMKLYIHAGYIYAVVIGLPLLRMPLGGSQWTTVQSDLYNILDIVNKGDDLFVTTEEDAVYRSSDGSNWTYLDSGTGLPDELCTSLEASDSIVYALYYRGIYASRDNGKYWEKFTTEPDINESRVLDIYSDTAGIFAIISNGGIYRSKDMKQWEPYNTGLPVTGTDPISGLPTYPATRSIIRYYGTLYLLSDSGVYYHSNKKGSWKKYNEGINYYSPINIFSSDSILFAGTYGDGLLRYNHPHIEAGNVTALHPHPAPAVKLHPNPVKDVLHIELPSEDATISVTDMLGKEWINEHVKGTKQYEINLSRLTNGLYVIKVNEAAGRFVKQ